MRDIWQFAKTMIEAYIEDDGFTKGAALAYYTTFSIAPIIIIVIAVSGFVFGQEAVEGKLFEQLDGLLGSEAARDVQGIVEASYASGDSWWATVIGVGTLLFGATGAFNQLKISLDAIWEIESKPTNGIIGFLTGRLTAFAMVVGLGFVLLISLAVEALAAGMSDALDEHIGIGGETGLRILTPLISLTLTTAIFAVIFKYLADVRIRWNEVLWGALFTSILFSLGRVAISYYIGNSSITSGFGAAGSLVALLVWTYYSSQIVFLGAEFIWTLGRRTGYPVLPDAHAVQIIKKTKRIDASEAARRAGKSEPKPANGASPARAESKPAAVKESDTRPPLPLPPSMNERAKQAAKRGSATELADGTETPPAGGHAFTHTAHVEVNVNRPGKKKETPVDEAAGQVDG